MPSIPEINAEYERLMRLVLAGRFTEAEEPTLDLRHALTREVGISYTKKRVESLLAQIAASKSHNGNGGEGARI